MEKCGICDEKVKMVSFVCNHSVCESCISQLKNFMCPYCRTDIRSSISEDLVKNIENNMEVKREEERREYLKTALYSVRNFILEFKEIYFVSTWAFPDEITIDSRDLNDVMAINGDVERYLKRKIFLQIEKFALDPNYTEKCTPNTKLKYYEDGEVVEEIVVF